MRREIAALFDHDGPFLTVYLDARSDQPQAEQILETRWKTARSGLANEGASDEDLAAIDATVAGATHIGGDTLAVVAAGGQVLLSRHLPAPPAADAWRLLCDALPNDMAALVRRLDDHGVGTLPRLLDTFVAEQTVALLEREREAEGVGATIEALERGAVATLLVHDDPADARMGWF